MQSTTKPAIARVAARITGKTPDSTESNLVARRQEYRTAWGIVAFVREILGADPAPYQEDILRAFVERRRAAIRGPHGLGKTALSAWIVNWAMAVFDTDVKVITTASAWRQLIHFTWPEIRKWARKANWSKIGMQIKEGRELLAQSFTIGARSAFAAASDNPSLLEGAHASIIIAVFDEAKAIPPAIFDALEGAFSTGEAYALAISTPGEPAGRFYDIHARKPGFEDWYVRHVTVAEAIAAGRINPDWVEARKRQWGEKSAVFQNRVLGEFADSDENSVIPLRWVELSNERYRVCEGKGEGTESYGVDPARFGTDKTALAHKVGGVVEWIQKYSKEDTMQTTGRVVAATGENKQVPIGVDVIGIGAGVYDRLNEQGYSVVSVNVGEKTSLTDATGQNHFVNLRSALWWLLRDHLDPANDTLIALPPDDDLTGDLTAPTYQYMSDGRIKVESKDDMRERIGRSTDSADAVALALYAPLAEQPSLEMTTNPFYGG